MKEIRQIKGVVSTEFSDENNNDNKTTILHEFDSEPGYYQQVIRPMLAPGHENELVYWVKSFGLIPNMQTCKNAKINDDCNKTMNWIPARVQDLYQWRCLGCRQKRAIREDSFFADVKCNFKNAFRILLGWCKGHDFESMAEILSIKKAVVTSLYNHCATVAEKYIRSHLVEWQIGGAGVVVVVDVYPEGCSNSTHTNSHNSKPILCISEVNTIPQKYWFEPLEKFSRNNVEQIKLNKEKVLEVIQDVVVAGSILVAPLNSTICSLEDLQCLKNRYPTMVSVDGLARHNNDQQNIFFNLETIWKSALTVCEEAQIYSHQNVHQFLISEMWRYRFGRDSFETLLYQLNLMQ